MRIPATWKRHLRELGKDSLFGIVIYLAPLVASENFEWSSQWWLIVAGGLARRVLVIVLSYLKRSLGDRTPSE